MLNNALGVRVPPKGADDTEVVPPLPESGSCSLEIIGRETLSIGYEKTFKKPLASQGAIRLSDQLSSGRSVVW
jgi:hypothetical protein